MRLRRTKDDDDFLHSRKYFDMKIFQFLIIHSDLRILQIKIFMYTLIERYTLQSNRR